MGVNVIHEYVCDYCGAIASGATQEEELPAGWQWFYQKLICPDHKITVEPTLRAFEMAALAELGYREFTIKREDIQKFHNGSHVVTLGEYLEIKLTARGYSPGLHVLDVMENENGDRTYRWKPSGTGQPK